MKERGCIWSGTLEQLYPHQDNCQYVDSKCPLNHQQTILKSNVNDHRNSRTKRTKETKEQVKQKLLNFENRHIELLEKLMNRLGEQENKLMNKRKS